jgi:hypothetical protein
MHATYSGCTSITLDAHPSRNNNKITKVILSVLREINFPPGEINLPREKKRNIVSDPYLYPKSYRVTQDSISCNTSCVKQRFHTQTNSLIGENVETSHDVNIKVSLNT